jgi:hypothetical protein
MPGAGGTVFGTSGSFIDPFRAFIFFQNLHGHSLPTRCLHL